MFYYPAHRGCLGGAGLAVRDGQGLSLWRSAWTLSTYIQAPSCAHTKLQVQGWELMVIFGEPWWEKGLFILRVEICTDRLQEKLGSPGDEVSLLLRNAEINPPSAVSAQPVLLITKVRLWLKLQWLFIITAES